MGESRDEIAEHRARVAALPLLKIRKAIVGWALKRGMSEERADDLTQAAILKLLQAHPSDWNRADDPNAIKFLIRKFKGMRKAEAATAAARRTELDTDKVEASPPSSDRGPADILIAREQATRARDELLRQVSDSPLAVRIVRTCMEQGEMKPAELAQHLGEDLTQVYRSQRRIARAVARIQRAQAQGNGESMQSEASSESEPEDEARA